MADNNILLSQLQDLIKNGKLNDLIKQAEVAMGKNEDPQVVEEKTQKAEKSGGGLGGLVKGLAVGGGIFGVLKILKMLKSFQLGKILGNLGKIAGVSSLMSKAKKLQDSPENTEAQENLLNELDMMVAVAIEDGVITPEEEAMLSKKAEELGLNVPEFIAEVREKCTVEA